MAESGVCGERDYLKEANFLPPKTPSVKSGVSSDLDSRAEQELIADK